MKKRFGGDRSITVAFLFLWTVFGCWANSTGAQTPPVNDNFADAMVLTGTSATSSGSILAASVEPGEPLPTDDSETRTVWWRWTAPDTGRLTLRAPHWGLGVYQGPTVDQLIPMARGDYEVFTHVNAGEEYFLQLADRAVGREEYELELVFTPYWPTDNDDFADAKRFWGTGNGADRVGSLVGATFEFDEPAAHMADNDKSIWWVWQAPQSANYTFLARYNTVTNLTYTVYRGTELSFLVPHAQGVDGIVFAAVAGEDYYIAVAAPPGVEGEVVIENYGQGLPPAARPVPGNLVFNGNFESSPDPREGWFSSGALNLVTPFWRVAEGSNAVELTGGDIWQDLTTVVGRRYRLRFAAFGVNEATTIGISARIDGEEIGRVENGAGFWIWSTFEFVATSTTTRLHLQSLVNRNFVDVISVTWVNEPPHIVNQPESRSARVGGSMVFQVGVAGASPLTYQWYHNNKPIPNATERVLSLDNLTSSNSGRYHVVVANEFGTDTSEPADLAVDASNDLLILLQPESRQVRAGTTVTLNVFAEGPRPITSYQWFRDDEVLDEQTARYLILPEVSSTDAGRYHVIVGDGLQSVRSLQAVLHVDPATGNLGMVLFVNFMTMQGVNAPVNDVDGTTRLAGDSYRAQLYAGASPDSLQPVGDSVPFRSDHLAGYFNGVAVRMPLDDQNQVHLQFRAWDAEKGISYEEARARGGRFGASPVVVKTLTPLPEFGPPPVPQAIDGIEGFSLQAGRPLFTTGRIEFNQWIARGIPEWRLIGEPGFTYSVERREPGNYWAPFLLLENPTGIVTFSDLSAPGKKLRYYRSRIVD